MSKVEDNQASFAGRVDSSRSPFTLGETESTWAVNVTMRGGIPQTRPGFATIFNMPCGHPQGIQFFTPTNSVPHLVVAIAGKVYVSPAPFREYRQLSGIQFYERSKFVAFADCLQSTDYDENGILVPLAVPRRVLVMQDGNTRAAFWDGGTARHLDPSPSRVFDEDSGERITQQGKDETRIGLWMAWAGNRLWVSRGPDVWASDIGNPLKFTEDEYLAEGRKFTMPEDVTGMIQPSSGQPLLVFGENTISFLRANIIDRRLWLDDPDFQRTEYGIGCVAPRSIINKLGLVWWYSPNGWTNLNFALQSFNDSRQRYFDKQMDWSKRNLSTDKTVICAGEIEDYTLVSTPSGSKWNRHTWVYDDYQDNPGWDGVWMGVKPVQWAKAVIDGTERIFCLSHDDDEVNRVWEGFQENRQDNRTPISCLLATRNFAMGGGGNKRFHHAEVFFRELSGDAEITTWVSSIKGPAQKAMNVLLRAKANNLSPDTFLSDSTTIESLSKQFRERKSSELSNKAANEFGVCKIESPRTASIDKAFNLIMAWDGQLAIDMIRMYGIAGQDNRFEGECSKDDEEQFAIRDNGAGEGQDNPFEYFYAEATETVNCPDETEGGVTVTASAFSLVSQRDAERRAELKAKRTAEGFLVCSPFGAFVDEEENVLLDENQEALVE